MVGLWWLVLVTTFCPGFCLLLDTNESVSDVWEYVNKSYEGYSISKLDYPDQFSNSSNGSDILFYSDEDCIDAKCGRFGKCIPNSSGNYKCQCLTGYKYDPKYKRCVIDYSRGNYDIKDRLIVAAILLGIIFIIFGTVCVFRAKPCIKLCRRRAEDDRHRSGSNGSFLELISESNDLPPSYSEVFTVTPQMYRSKPPSYEEVIRMAEISEWRTAELEVPQDDSEANSRNQERINDSQQTANNSETSDTGNHQGQIERPQQETAETVNSVESNSTEHTQPLATSQIPPEESQIRIVINRDHQQRLQGTVNLGYEQEECFV